MKKYCRGQYVMKLGSVGGLVTLFIGVVTRAGSRQFEVVWMTGHRVCYAQSFERIHPMDWRHWRAADQRVVQDMIDRHRKVDREGNTMTKETKNSSPFIGLDEVSSMRKRKQAAAAEARSSSQAEYERRELADAHRKLDDLRRRPLADRREAQAEFLEAMRDQPEIVGERIEWLLRGNYGYGPMQLAKRVLASPRMNRSAALTQMIGAYEWQSPEEMSRTAWKKLSETEQARLEKSVQLVIASAEQAIKESP